MDKMFVFVILISRIIFRTKVSVSQHFNGVIVPAIRSRGGDEGKAWLNQNYFIRPNKRTSQYSWKEYIRGLVIHTRVLNVENSDIFSIFSTFDEYFGKIFGKFRKFLDIQNQGRYTGLVLDFKIPGTPKYRESQKAENFWQTHDLTACI